MGEECQLEKRGMATPGQEGAVLSQVEVFLGFIHKWGENGCVTDGQIRAASAMMWTILWSVMEKGESSRRTKLSINLLIDITTYWKNNIASTSSNNEFPLQGGSAQP